MKTRFNRLLPGGLFVTVLVAGLSSHAVSAAAFDWGDRSALQGGWLNQDREDEERDPVVLSFSTVGDSRQDPVSPDPTTVPVPAADQIWLQNTKAWSRIIRSIEAQKSNFLFFNGDMIMGYGKAGVPADTTTVTAIVKSDLMQFYTQYAYWRGMVSELLETGTYVVPVAGNHEVQSKALGKKAQVENENAWRANMGDLILDTSRFQQIFNQLPANVNISNTGPVDGLASDQTQLSYSFDFKGSHFVVINTDPVGKDSHAPTIWLSSDLASAKARGLKHFFVFGHKLAYTYYYGASTSAPLPTAPAGLDADIAARDAFWQVIEQYGATYFCGHEHIFNITQPTVSTGGKAYQVLVGSGGSPFDASPTAITISPFDRYYAWATVKIHQSGKVQLNAYGFDDQFGATQQIDEVTLSEQHHRH